MTAYLPPDENLNIYNPVEFSEKQALTLTDAKKRLLEFPTAQGLETLLATNIQGTLTIQGDFTTEDLTLSQLNYTTLNPALTLAGLGDTNVWTGSNSYTTYIPTTSDTIDTTEDSTEVATTNWIRRYTIEKNWDDIDPPTIQEFYAGTSTNTWYSPDPEIYGKYQRMSILCFGQRGQGSTGLTQVFNMPIPNDTSISFDYIRTSGTPPDRVMTLDNFTKNGSSFTGTIIHYNNSTIGEVNNMNSSVRQSYAYYENITTTGNDLFSGMGFYVYLYRRYKGWYNEII
jgi:hypothetical protein